MSNKRTIESLIASGVTLGSACQVHSFGCWYPGIVMTFGRKNVQVSYTTSGGKRLKTFSPGHVVPAGTYTEGVRGQPEPQTAFGIKQALERVTLVWGGKTVLSGGTALTHGDVIDLAKAAGAEEDEIAKAIEAAPGAVK